MQQIGDRPTRMGAPGSGESRSGNRSAGATTDVTIHGGRGHTGADIAGRAGATDQQRYRKQR